jgi:hypothetical protein
VFLGTAHNTQAHMFKSLIFVPNVAVKWLTRLFDIWEATGVNFFRKSNFCD